MIIEKNTFCCLSFLYTFMLFTAVTQSYIVMFLQSNTDVSFNCCFLIYIKHLLVSVILNWTKVYINHEEFKQSLFSFIYIHCGYMYSRQVARHSQNPKENGAFCHSARDSNFESAFRVSQGLAIFKAISQKQLVIYAYVALFNWLHV